MQIKLIALPSLRRKCKRFVKNVFQSLLYSRSKLNTVSGSLNEVVFVCKGNICRSAFAEFYFKSLVAGKDVEVFSCGLEVDREVPSPSDVISVGSNFGVDMRRHLSKGITAATENAGIIIAMEFTQYIQLTSMFPSSKRKIHLLKSFSAFPDNWLINIYDPFGLGEKETHDCFEEIKESLLGLARFVVKSKG